MTGILEWIGRWPGKSADEVGTEHPAIYHMLDVAAVAERLLPGETRYKEALVLLVALHDIGKISAHFRDALREDKKQAFRHWEVSEALLRHFEVRLEELLGSAKRVLPQLIAAVAGHHGGPPKAATPTRQQDEWFRMRRAAGPDALHDAERLVEAFFALWPGASLEGMSHSEAARLSWWLSGLTVAADWVGSNTSWFPACSPFLSLDDYLSAARRRAVTAVEAAGLAGPDVRTTPLFEFTLRPMQLAATDVALPEGPVMAVIEDETGSGKTEAALILAARMMAVGKGKGLYFALPTMATADAMFLRMATVAGRMFDGVPSLALVHGRAAMHRGFRDLIGRAAGDEDDVSCAPWLADARRRALLADVGVGTIDQALMAVLPTRFSTLRHWGLSDKILIVDEAHDYDPYVARELEALLRTHAAAGGSAILMTATLPSGMRRRYRAAFEVGAGRTPPAEPGSVYPALTVGPRTMAVAPGPGPGKGPVEVRRLDRDGDAIDLMAEAAGQGKECAQVWVRNAVDDAIAAVRALRDRGVAADLLHARFALCDRRRIEAAALARYGRDRGDTIGRVLVSTQVIEASLDLDFDIMVSDVAPVAALIQRAGRLWRHMDRRPASSRPTERPVLHVLAPDPGVVEGERWLQGVLDRGAFVYSAADQWRTADVLFRYGRIDAPEGLRSLIEAVHGDQAATVPEALERAEQERQGKDAAGRTIAGHNIVAFDDGYRSAGAVWDDAHYPTRLGEPQRVLRLARIVGCTAIPWSDEGQGEEAWILSEVMASERRLAKLELPEQDAPAIEAATAGWPDWRRKAVVVCPVREGGAICEGLGYDRDLGLVFE